MDRAISKSEIKSVQKKKIIKSAIVTISVIVIIYFIMSLFKPSLNRNEILLAKTFKGDIEETIFSIGTIIPKFEESIISPIQTKINSIRKTIGSRVKKNESILGLDKTQIISDYNKLKDEHDLKLNKVNQLKLKLERELIELKSRIEIKELEIESLHAKKIQEEKLFKIGAGSAESFKISKLNFKIAEKELVLLNRKIKNQE